MFFRTKPARHYRYLQIARSVRINGKVRQQIVCTLGRLDVLEASGQLERLLRSGLKHCAKIKVLDAHSAGETKPVSIRKIGPDLVFGRLWQELAIGEVIEKLCAGRRFGFRVERAIYLTVLHRLFVSGSDRAAERWKETYRIPGAEEIDLHQLYRAMAFLGSPVEGEGALGAPRCTKDLIEEALFERRRDLFTEVGLVFFDTTSIYFEGQGGKDLGRHGHSKDHRPDLHQMIVGIALDSEGRPLCCEMWPGNTADAKTFPQVVERMRARFRVTNLYVVADRGMVSAETLAAFSAMEPPVHYIVGVRMRRQKEVGGIVLQSRQPWVEITPPRRFAKDPAPLKIKEVQVEDRRYVVCLNEEERRKDAHDREAIVASLRDALRQGDKTLVGNKGYRRFLKTEPASHFAVDEEQIEADALYDGIWVLRTDTDLDAETVAHAYKMLWMVEAIFRTAKSILETRPIYHRRDETIRGHVFCSYLALILKRELEERMSANDLKWEWAEVIRGLDSLQEVEADLQGQRYVLRSQIIGDASQALRGAGVAAPPTLRPGK
jgi:DDE family transposase